TRTMDSSRPARSTTTTAYGMRAIVPFSFSERCRDASVPAVGLSGLCLGRPYVEGKPFASQYAHHVVRLQRPVRLRAGIPELAVDLHDAAVAGPGPDPCELSDERGVAADHLATVGSYDRGQHEHQQGQA